MTTPKAKFAGLALIAALCAGFTLGLTACTDERARTGAETPPAEVDFNAGVSAYKQGDYATALREWHPLAKQGNADAQHNLGVMYGNGEDVPQDYVQAHMWFDLAASSIPPGPPGEGRDSAVNNRDIYAKMMTPAQISEAQKLAREWRPR